MEQDEAAAASVDLIIAVASALIRKGVLTPDDLLLYARDMDENGKHLVQCAIAGADLPERVEMDADKIRAAFRVITGGANDA